MSKMTLPSYPDDSHLHCNSSSNSWCNYHVPWGVSWLSQPRQVLLNPQSCLECERVGNQFLSLLAWESKLGQAVSWQSTFIAHHSSVVGKVVQLCPRGSGSIQSRLKGVSKKCQKWSFPPTLMIVICIEIRILSALKMFQKKCIGLLLPLGSSLL